MQGVEKVVKELQLKADNREFVHLLQAKASGIISQEEARESLCKLYPHWFNDSQSSLEVDQ